MTTTKDAKDATTSATPAPDLRSAVAWVAWARACLARATHAPPGSEDRRVALEELRRVTQEARSLLDQREGRAADLARGLLRLTELGLGRLARPPR